MIKKKMVRKSSKSTSSSVDKIKARIKARKSKLVEEQKEVRAKKKIAGIKKKKRPTLSKSKSKKVISESKKAEIKKIIESKKLAKKSAPILESLKSKKAKSVISESIKKKLEGKRIGKRRVMGKNEVIKEEDEFEEIIGTEAEIEGEEGITVDADIDLSTDSEVELVISQEDLTTVISELSTDEDFINAVVNQIAGTDEPLDEMNDEIETDVDTDMIDDDDEFNEGDLLEDMLEEEGIKGKSKVIKESVKFDSVDSNLILEGYEAVKHMTADKKNAKIFNYKVKMLDKVTDVESTLGRFYLIQEGVINAEDEIKKFDVTVDDEGDTIEISSSSKIADVSSLVTNTTGLSVGKVSRTITDEEFDIDEEEDEYSFDLERSNVNKW